MQRNLLRFLEESNRVQAPELEPQRPGDKLASVAIPVRPSADKHDPGRNRNRFRLHLSGLLPVAPELERSIDAV